MVYTCRAFIAMPGGFGTLDELFEVLTLMQSKKIESAELMPVVLFGEAFWRRVVDWPALLELGTISQSDLDRLFFTSSVDDAVAHVTGRLRAYEAAKMLAAAPPLAPAAPTPTPEAAAGGAGGGGTESLSPGLLSPSVASAAGVAGSPTESESP